MEYLKIFKEHKKKIIAIGILILITPACFLSKMRRPRLTGTVLDYNNNPVENCEVGEVFTNEKGMFDLPEKRYRTFFIPEIFMMEAPPLYVSEMISKAGYKDESIEIFHRYGGGLSKGTTWKLDTIYLAKMNQKIDVNSIFKGTWNSSMTKNLDTVFLISSRLKNLTSSQNNAAYYAKYELLTDNYLRSYGPNNLPDSMIRKLVTMRINRNNLSINKLITYGPKDGGSSEKWNNYKKDDSLNYQGYWNLIDSTKINFRTTDSELNGDYKILEADLMFLKLKKIK